MMGIASLPQRIGRFVQRNGITGIPSRMWKGIKTRPSINVYFIFIGPIQEGLDLPPQPEGAEVAILSQDDAETLETMSIVAKEGMSDPLGGYQKRIPSGEVCYTLRMEGKLAAFVWLAMRDSVATSLGRRLRILPDELYLYDAFTLPEYRGRGFMPYLTAYACLDAAKTYGKQNALAIIRYNNHSSLRAKQKLTNRKRVGMIGALRFFGVRANFYWPPEMRIRMK